MTQMYERSNSDLLRSVSTLLAILAAFVTNILANIFPFNDITIGEISNQKFRDVLIIPANYAFSIWGLIYLALISFGIYQALPAQRHHPRLRRISYLLVLASLAQIAWVFLFAYLQFGWSVLAMLIILLSLILTYLRLQIGKERVPPREKWFINIPLSIYLAWISVATVVNIASTLYDWGWEEPNTLVFWTVVMLGVSAAIAAVVTIQRGDTAFNLVFVWAYIAIAVRQSEYMVIVSTALGLAIGLILLLLVPWWKKRRKT
ncbi:tryptophan-rich sensory protein [Phormidium pseudopriestleyi FRX01]|uniref:Tryptophan-rich sensory protein n=1 Tax=Phormidium pseudopriestleyi FRX01 TaxID=1759528 RepID=A0ABS3FMU3_9CYAN|nr:tryptophan-rich sensory protein [Phormidium pseudopriestleyi]MBO0348158.1 tryptophan-rich sensory protein [Phormidium pseudopriestleyi FRX01]